MRVLFDTNILLDIGLGRQPFATASFTCFSELIEAGETPLIAPHGLATFYYIVAQALGSMRAEVAVKDLVASTLIVPFDHTIACRAIELKFKDFEDAMIAAAAEASGSAYILTRNGDDFLHSPVPAINPETFLIRMRG